MAQIDRAKKNIMFSHRIPNIAATLDPDTTMATPTAQNSLISSKNLEAGMNEYITRPTELAELEKTCTNTEQKTPAPLTRTLYFHYPDRVPPTPVKAEHRPARQQHNVHGKHNPVAENRGHT